MARKRDGGHARVVVVLYLKSRMEGSRAWAWCGPLKIIIMIMIIIMATYGSHVSTLGCGSDALFFLGFLGFLGRNAPSCIFEEVCANPPIILFRHHSSLYFVILSGLVYTIHDNPFASGMPSLGDSDT